MHHKRGRAKQARAGCLFCKPHKFGHGMENDIGNHAYRKEVAVQSDVKHYLEHEWEYELVWAGPEWGYV